ncbi:MAG: hypothetical protein R3F23_08695 [Verrucomicrobiia bacterium]
MRTPKSTLRQIKSAVRRLDFRQQQALRTWLEEETLDRLNDEELMAVAVAGARILDRREAKREAFRSTR